MRDRDRSREKVHIRVDKRNAHVSNTHYEPRMLPFVEREEYFATVFLEISFGFLRPLDFLERSTSFWYSSALVYTQFVRTFRDVIKPDEFSSFFNTFKIVIINVNVKINVQIKDDDPRGMRNVCSRN